MSFLAWRAGESASAEALDLRGWVSGTAHQHNTSASGLGAPRGPCPGDYNGPAGIHPARVFIPCQDPHGACSLIRDVSGEGDLRAIGSLVHVDTADHIPVPAKGTLEVAAAPLAPLDFLFPAAYRRLSARSPL